MSSGGMVLVVIGRGYPPTLPHHMIHILWSDRFVFIGDIVTLIWDLYDGRLYWTLVYASIQNESLHSMAGVSLPSVIWDNGHSI